MTLKLYVNPIISENNFLKDGVLKGVFEEAKCEVYNQQSLTANFSVRISGVDYENIYKDTQIILMIINYFQALLLLIKINK